MLIICSVIVVKRVSKGVPYFSLGHFIVESKKDEPHWCAIHLIDFRNNLTYRKIRSKVHKKTCILFILTPQQFLKIVFKTEQEWDKSQYKTIIRYSGIHYKQCLL